MLKSLIGDKKFYKRLFVLVLPIMVQNGITNFVNMLDNIMIGRVGTVQMSGVAITNQLIFVFNLCIFGAISGAGIFTAQFFGKGDRKGVRDTFRFKLLSCFLLAALGIGVFLLFGNQLIGLYLKGDGNAADAAASLKYAREYMLVMLIGLLPYTVVQCYSGTLREIGESMPPMMAGIIAVCVNLVGNYILIFGKLGAPALGVTGAAIATVLSRFVELAIVAGWTYKNRTKATFIVGAYRSFRIPRKLAGQILLRGFPLLINEAFWALGIATVNQGYSLLGLEVVAATNISSTFWNVFAIVFTATGNAIGIILGQMLGAGEIEEARSACKKLIAFTVAASMVVGGIYAVAAIFIPEAYNTGADIRHMATRMMQISAMAFPLEAYAHATYFTLRSGGQTAITLFDSAYVCLINVPTVYLLASLTEMPILGIFAIVQFSGIIKCLFGGILVQKGIWLKKIVG